MILCSINIRCLSFKRNKSLQKKSLQTVKNQIEKFSDFIKYEKEQNILTILYRNISYIIPPLKPRNIGFQERIGDNLNVSIKVFFQEFLSLFQKKYLKNRRMYFSLSGLFILIVLSLIFSDKISIILNILNIIIGISSFGVLIYSLKKLKNPEEMMKILTVVSFSFSQTPNLLNLVFFILFYYDKHNARLLTFFVIICSRIFPFINDKIYSYEFLRSFQPKILSFISDYEFISTETIIYQYLCYFFILIIIFHQPIKKYYKYQSYKDNIDVSIKYTLFFGIIGILSIFQFIFLYDEQY